MAHFLPKLPPGPAAVANEEANVAVVPFDLPFLVDFRKVGKPVANIGIVEASAQRAGAGAWDIFLRLAAGTEAGRADLTLTQDGTVIKTESVALEAGRSQRIAFPLRSVGSTSLVATLQPKQADALSADDRVRMDLPASRNLRVRCDAGLGAFRFALEGLANIELVETGADLAIVTTEADVREEPASLVIGSIPESLVGLIEIAEQAGRVIDWQRSDPLLQHVQLAGVSLLRVPQYINDAGQREVEEAGYRVTAEVEGGPLIVRRQDGRNVQYVMPLPIDQSTLTYRVGFPVMVANAVDLGFRQAELSAIRGVQAGVLPPIPVERTGTYVIEGPEGSEATFEVGSERVIRGVVADELGDYEISREGESVRTLGVNLLDATESSLSSVDEIIFSEVAVEASEEEIDQEQPLWRWLALGALALMLLEWWYFHRPVAVPTRPLR